MTAWEMRRVRQPALVLRQSSSPQPTTKTLKIARSAFRSCLPGQSVPLGQRPASSLALARANVNLTSQVAALEPIRAFLLQMASAVVVFDAQGCVLLVNSAAEQLLAAKANQVLGRAFTLLFEPPANAPPLLPAKALLNSQSELLLVSAGGERIPLSVAGSPLHNKDGQLEAIVCICNDLRPHKTLEMELRHAQKLESVGQLAAGIAHEINTPVQFIGDSVCFLQDAFVEMSQLIDGLIHCIRAEGSDNESSPTQCLNDLEREIDYDFLREEVPAAVQRIMQGVGRVAGIVRAMKTFAHPGSSEMAVCNLNESIETTLTVARSEYKYVADVTLALSPIPEVVCNQGDINQVLLNLIVNAAHAIEPVAQASGKRGKIHVSTRQEAADVIIEVSDTGCGIPSEIRERVYDPFFTTKPAGKGTGQGLSIAQRIVVEKHGGALEFDSEVGRGTTFRIQIPIHGKVAGTSAGPIL